MLWYTEIEQMKVCEVAPLLGLKATAVAQLAMRAREGLREAWITAHLKNLDDGSTCQWTTERLGSYTRQTVSARDKVKIDEHLMSCTRCAIVAGEAEEVSSRLALVLLPLTIGATGAAGYLAAIQGGGQSLVALAAGTSPVMPAAVVADPSQIAMFAGLTATPAAAGTTQLGATIGSAGASGSGVGASAGGGVMVGVLSVAAAGVFIAGAAIVGVISSTSAAQPPASDYAAGSMQDSSQALPDAVVDASTPLATPPMLPAPSPSDIPRDLIPTPPIPRTVAPQAPVAPAPPREAGVAEPVIEDLVVIPPVAVSPEPVPTVAPTLEPTPEPTVAPTLVPSPEPTVVPTPEPTVEPTVEPTPEPTVAPTPEPTAEPTPEPTAKPTPEPTVEPTPEPTPEPTVEPTPEPTPTTAPSTSPVVNAWSMSFFDRVLSVSLSGGEGRTIDMYIDDVYLTGGILSDGEANFRIWSHRFTTDSLIYFQYADGAQEKSDVHTAAEWAALVNQQ